MGGKHRTMTLTQLKVAKTSLGFSYKEQTLVGYRAKCRRQSKGRGSRKPGSLKEQGKGGTFQGIWCTCKAGNMGTTPQGRPGGQQWPHWTGLVYQVIEDGQCPEGSEQTLSFLSGGMWKMHGREGWQ